MPLSDFEIKKFLGKGSYGSVFKASRSSDGQVYAIKEINVKYMKRKEREEALNEIRILASVFHPNIVGYYESFVENDKIYIVTEFASGGDLQNLIETRKMKRYPFSEDEIWPLFLQLCVGIRTLHKHHILHRDLKSANIFLSADKSMVKIGDLGVAKLLKQENSLAKTSIGTPYYISPEIWKNSPYNNKSDMWSLGVLLYEMCTFRHPFEARDIKGLASRVLAGRYSALPKMYSDDLKNVVSALLSRNSASRPNIDELLASPPVASRLHLCPTPIQQHILHKYVSVAVYG
ncbi:hypothetical protein KIPB_004899 [Kipferlia bialata]|uniref:non-specific serine/threonine protein kinase n=1 Tax=Kipferlia bialata TaxID=797122 RepID=A0A9K3CVT5_9EUKA|nr:hypothetical protein KIPB_004899 [Kipferlia bialata]|eukprot:g4899.t1